MLALTDQAQASLIGAVAAIAGGLVGVTGGYAIERLKSGEARQAQKSERVIQAASRYAVATANWAEFTGYVAHKRATWSDEEWQAQRHEYNSRTQEMRTAQLEMQIVGSDALADWIDNEFLPAENQYQDQVRRIVERQEEPEGLTTDKEPLDAEEDDEDEPTQQDAFLEADFNYWRVARPGPCAETSR